MANSLHPRASNSRPPSRTPSKSPLSNGHASNAPPSRNQTPPSRKRSRSGSRINNNNVAEPLSRPSTHDIILDQYISRDQMHASAVHRDQERTRELFELLRLEKDGFAAFDAQRRQARARMPTQPIYPSQRRRPGNRRTRELRIPRKEHLNQAEQVDELVPIRLDIEQEKLRLRDTFTWNVHDHVVPPEIFAQGLVEDFKIPPEASHFFAQQVYQSMHEQMEDFHPHIFLEEDALDPHLPYTAYKNDELRIAIRLNITIGQHTLVDNFDWDINNPHNSPEEFARQMATDLSLSGEFMTAIAHCIREQTQLFTKALYTTAHPFDGRIVEDADVRDNLLPSPIPSVFRPFFNAKEFSPYLYELNDVDLERQELVFSREQRQQKRSAVNRKGGPSLPDLKDRLKTWRTLVVSSTIPGAASTPESSGLLKIVRKDGRGRGRWKGPRGDDEEDEDLLESEESDIDSPMRASIQGTNRTRGIQRGAASAAQAAMRANLTRSQTPDISAIHHHETRTLPRKLGGYEMHDDDDTHFLIRLKLPRERYRQWWRDWKAGRVQLKFTAPPSETPQPPPPGGLPPNHPGALHNRFGSAGGTPQLGHTPAPGVVMGPPPPTTPRLMNGQMPPGMQQQQAGYPMGVMGPGGAHSRPASIDPAQLHQRQRYPGAGLDGHGAMSTPPMGTGHG